MEALRELLEKGYVIEIASHTREDYDDQPELRDLESYKVNIIKGNNTYEFNFEYDADFDGALDLAIEYVGMYNN